MKSVCWYANSPRRAKPKLNVLLPFLRSTMTLPNWNAVWQRVRHLFKRADGLQYTMA